MDERAQLDNINWELSLLLRNLTQYRENVNIADDTTIKLLSDMLNAIEHFLCDHKSPQSSDGTEKREKFDIDETKFEISRFITCRICCLQIPFSQVEYLNHVGSDYHKAQLSRHLTTIDFNQNSISAVTNGTSSDHNGNQANDDKRNPAANNSGCTPQSNGSWRDREPTPTMPSGAEHPMNYQNAPMSCYPPIPNFSISNQKLGQPLYPPQIPVFSTPMAPWTQQNMPFAPPHMRYPFAPPTAQYPKVCERSKMVQEEAERIQPKPKIAYVSTESGKNPPQDLAKSRAASRVAMTPSSSSIESQSKVMTGANLIQKYAEKPQSKFATSATSSSAASDQNQKYAKEPKPKSATCATASTPKPTSIVPPSVFDEDIFEFIEAQGSAKRTESLPVALSVAMIQPTPSIQSTRSAQSAQSVQPPNKPEEKRIASASTSAQIKPSRPYALNMMYSTFSHLKASTATASVPVATKPAAAKPTQSESLPSKPPNGDGAQIDKSASKPAHRPNQPQPSKPVNQVKTQNMQMPKRNTTDSKPSSIMGAGLSDKLSQLFAAINELKPKAELEQIRESRSLQRSSSIVSLPANAATKNTSSSSESTPSTIRSANSQARAQPQRNLRGRSLSNSNIADSSKGAIPKQKSVSNQNINRTGKQREALTRFFARDLTPILSRAMNIAASLSTCASNKTITDEIERLLRPKYPTVKCYLVGSRSYGIGNETSPFDIYLDLHDTFHTDKMGKVYIDGISNAEELFAQSAIWSDVACSDQTRYGILSVTHVPTRTKCRMIFGTGVPVRNSEVVQCLFDAQPVCRQLVICVQLAMIDTQSPSLRRFQNGYVITMLVLFLFQKQGKLPSVKSLQEASSARIKCGENAVQFNKPKDVPICSTRFLDVLISFFTFYSEFKFGENIVSVFEGREVSHNIRNADDDRLDPSLLRFKRFIEAEPRKWPSHGVCIQDVFMHKRNVTVLMGGGDLDAFRCFCRDALVALQTVGTSVRY